MSLICKNYIKFFTLLRAFKVDPNQLFYFTLMKRLSVIRLCRLLEWDSVQKWYDTTFLYWYKRTKNYAAILWYILNVSHRKNFTSNNLNCTFYNFFKWVGRTFVISFSLPFICQITATIKTYFNLNSFLF